MGLFLFSNWEPVYEFSMKCYKCGKKTIVYYPEDTAYHHFDIPTLDILYSNTQKDNTIDNKCSHCGAYQGNWFVHNEFVHEMYDEDTNLILYPAGVKELNPICARCGKKVDYEVPIKEIIDFDFEFNTVDNPPDYFCSKCIKENYADFYESNLDYWINI